MTEDDNNEDSTFRGLMKNLNLDDSKFKTYKTNFHQLPLQQLTEIKQELESQLSLLFDVLTHYYNADMNTSLLTSDGFPRNDIDVLGIRLVRVRIIRLRNDHKDVLSIIENKLIEHFQANPSESSEIRQEFSSPPPQTYTIPFAQVQEVVANGPASLSGLQEGDKIILFSGIHAGNHNKLSSLAQTVRNHTNTALSVVVLRGTEQVSLELRPTDNWDGQGLLGCRLIPL